MSEEEKTGFIERFMQNIESYPRGYKRENEPGNTVYSAFIGSRDRLQFDFGPCSHDEGWEQYDTDQDAWYFGVWIHRENMMVATYAEGDFSVTTCPTLESFRAEIESMNAFYGEPPAHTRAFDPDTGVWTHFIQERPKL